MKTKFALTFLSFVLILTNINVLGEEDISQVGSDDSLTDIASSTEEQNLSVGCVIAIQGTAFATAPAPEAQPRLLELKSPVFLQDKITTEKGAKLQIMFNDDSVLSQGEQSEITIDEYVYSPGDSKDDVNCSLSIMKGIFRIVTGKITDLNPKRFKVRTRMATIGIRGCELGFKVTEVSENIYIIELHGQETIMVYAKPNVGGGVWQGLTDEQWDDPEVAKQHLINVTRKNRVVSIVQGSGATERDLQPDELMSLIEAVTPDDTSSSEEEQLTEEESDSTQETTEEEQEPVDDEEQLTGEDADSTQETTEEQQEPVDEEEQQFVDTDPTTETTDDVLDTELPDDSVADDNTFTDEPVLPTDLTPDNTLANIVNDSTQTDTASETTETQTSPETTDASTPASEEQPAVPPPAGPAIVGSSAGTGWDWGVWNDGTVQYSGDFLSVAEFQAVADGAILHALTGQGASGAVIRHTNTKYVNGTCDLNVMVGQKLAPYWDGIFALANGDGDSLDFEVAGNIQSGGRMTANQMMYLMQVNNVQFRRGSITAESISGNLAGPGTGTQPITGAAGKYHFEHGGAATVDGAFGTDLN